jgi:hypothetical protein
MLKGLYDCISMPQVWDGRIVLHPGWANEPWVQPEGYPYEFIAISEGYVPLMEVYGSNWLEM